MKMLRELVNFSAARKRSAVVQMEDGLSQYAEALVDSYTPTHSAIRILQHIDRAVLPASSASDRAMIWHGRYGSGKSHLAVLVGHLLGHGAHTPAQRAFRQRLANIGHGDLADRLAHTFLAETDRDCRPYLLVPLYASAGSTLADALVSALYRALRLAGHEPDSLLPKTEFTVAGERLDQILAHSPALANAPLEQWGLNVHYLTTAELRRGLAERRPEALETFRAWYPKIHHGQTFNAEATGGLGVVACYQEAAKNLDTHHRYAGIAILWDEFGHALEELFKTSARNPAQELMLLQQFVEATCAPATGHVLFIGLTHYDLPEYAQRTGIDPSLTDRLHTVSGRFTRNLRVELRAAEAEGYHLISAQSGLTQEGKHLLQTPAAIARRDVIATQCGSLPVFEKMRFELFRIVETVYPFHPVTVAGLLAISTYGQFAQANRTLFTFLRNLLDAWPDLETSEVNPDRLYGQELIRPPALFKVYRDAIGSELPKVLQQHQRAEAQVVAAPLEAEARSRYLALLDTLVLGAVLGKDLQPNRALLAATLYDAPDNAMGPWVDDLEWLRAAGLAYESAKTGVWQLQGDQGVDLEDIITKAETALRNDLQVYDLLTRPECQDLLPHVTKQDLEPSPQGIVRTIDVVLSPWPFEPEKLPTATDHLLSAQVFLILPPDDLAATRVLVDCQRIRNPLSRLVYLWVPLSGVNELGLPLRRYVALDTLLSRQEAFSEGLLIRLQDAWEAARIKVMELLSERFGRRGLEQGIQRVRILCSEDWTQPWNSNAHAVKSWHAFREHVTEQVHRLYPKDIQVRAMNVNQLCPDNNSRRSLSKFSDLLHTILHFSEASPNDQTDLLGLRDTSENAAVIDGLFGANNLFSQRAEGWHLKSAGETIGPINEVLALIERHVVGKRERAAAMKDLRKQLTAPPYGIPAQVLPLLAAVALRPHLSRLVWVGAKGRIFEEILAGAFEAEADEKLRWEELNSRERGALALLRRALDQFEIPCPVSSTADPPEETTARRLHAYLDTLNEESLKGSTLRGKDRDFLNRLRRTQVVHEFATALVEWLDTNKELANCMGDPAQCPESWGRIETLIRTLVEARDQRARKVWDALWATLREALNGLSPPIRQELATHLATLANPLAKALAPLITAVQPSDEQIDALIKADLGKNAGDCSDLDLGGLQGKLPALLVPPESLETRRTRVLTQLQGNLATWAGDAAERREFLASAAHSLGYPALGEAMTALSDSHTEALNDALLNLYETAAGNPNPAFKEAESTQVMVKIGQWQMETERFETLEQRRDKALSSLTQMINVMRPADPVELKDLRRALQAGRHPTLVDALNESPLSLSTLMRLYQSALGRSIDEATYRDTEVSQVCGTIDAWQRDARQTMEDRKNLDTDLRQVLLRHWHRKANRDELLAALQALQTEISAWES